MTVAAESDAPHVAGWLSHAGDVIEVLSIDAITPGPGEMHAEGETTVALEARP
jgi:hypothetical protein